MSTADDQGGSKRLTDTPSPPPHEMLYEWPATMAAGVMVKAIGEVWARAATTTDAPAKRVLVKCMLIIMVCCLASDGGLG